MLVWKTKDRKKRNPPKTYFLLPLERSCRDYSLNASDIICEYRSNQTTPKNCLKHPQILLMVRFITQKSPQMPSTSGSSRKYYYNLQANMTCEKKSLRWTYTTCTNLNFNGLATKPFDQGSPIQELQVAHKKMEKF